MNFMFLAARWKKLVGKWEELEWVLLQEIDETYDPRILRRKARRIVVIWCVIGVISQILFRINQYFNTTECWGFSTRLEAYFNLQFPELFTFVSYSQIVAYVASVASTICDFSRCYLDMFLTVICMALRDLFHILNQKILTTPLNVSKTFTFDVLWLIYISY